MDRLFFRTIEFVKTTWFEKFFQFTFIGFCAVSLSLQTTYLNEGIVVWDGYESFLFCLTLFAYHFKDPSQVERSIAYTMGLLASIITLYFNYNTQLIILVTVISASPYFFFSAKYCPRNNTFLKPIAIGFFWAMMTCVLPMTERHHLESIPLILSSWGIFAERFFFITALAIAYDISDAQKDSKNGLQTFYLRFGANGTLIASLCCLGVSFVFSYVNFLRNIYTIHSLIFVSLATLVSCLVLARTSVFPFKTIKHKLLIDSMIVLKFVLILFANEVLAYLLG